MIWSIALAAFVAVAITAAAVIWRKRSQRVDNLMAWSLAVPAGPIKL